MWKLAARQLGAAVFVPRVKGWIRSSGDAGGGKGGSRSGAPTIWRLGRWW